MIVLICNNNPKRMRGILKRWFIEPKPNVFISNINMKIEKLVIEYIQRNLKIDENIGILAIYSSNSMQGYDIEYFDDVKRESININNFTLMNNHTQHLVQLKI